jgi:4-hydroxybenzoate polyprenyltransferase
LRLKPEWFDPFFILRPTLFFPAWTAFLAGAHQGDSSGGRILFFLSWLALASGSAFLINEWTDRREDHHNEKLLPLWGDRFSARSLRLELVFLIAATLGGAVYAGGELSSLLALFFIIAGVLYNFPPVRLKSRPILGIVACGVGGILLFIIGARSAGAAYSTALPASLPYFFAGCAVSLLTHIPDMEGDRACGIRTFPLRYSIRAAAVLALLLVIAALSAAVLLKDPVMSVAALLSLPFFVRFYRRGTPATAQTAVKIAVFSLAVTVALTWLPFLFLIAGYYFFARWYHRERLGLDYPTFSAKEGEPQRYTGATRNFIHSTQL